MANPTRGTRSDAVRLIAASSVPNLVQWVNLYVYAGFAPYFRTAFFDPADENSLIWVYAVFAVTFVMRPVGSWIFGRIADRRGRRPALIGAVSLMAACSLVLAVCPSQARIGGWAAVVLVLIGVVQGIATGGEYGTAAVALTEAATSNRRGFFASFQSATIVGGLVVAQVMLLVTLAVGGRAGASTWGWRGAFAVAGLAALPVIWSALRARSAAPRPVASALRGSMRILLTQHWRALGWVMLLTAGGTAAFYTLTVSVPQEIRETMRTARGDVGELQATVAVIVALVVLMILQPVGGALSDRVGRRPLLVFFGVAGIVVAPLLLWGANALTDVAAITTMLVIAAVVITGYLSVNGVAKAERFPPEVRALGVGFGYAIANSLFGGTAPLLLHASRRAGHEPWFAVYLCALIVVTLAAALAARGKAPHRPRHPEHHAGGGSGPHPPA
ncbi:MFS transporter [Microbacterium sp.]|uniref:MFS transporter n=1 Tax=Microbacterium sp. TaxID=51671 RepID=UPI001AC34506|nr:MFS transporter [Microbacterium sp.]MBN9194066.1 MFS transporter [Microbacterium sp.]